MEGAEQFTLKWSLFATVSHWIFLGIEFQMENSTEVISFNPLLPILPF